MTSENLAALVPALMAAVPEEVMLRYQRETCVNEDLDYKLLQLLAAAAHDAPKGKSVEQAAQVINECLLLRDGLQIDSILHDDYFPSDLVPKLEDWSCMSVVGEDTRGNTVIYFNLKKFNPSEYAKVWQAGHRAVPAQFKGHPEFDDPAVVNYCSLWYVRMMEWIHDQRFDHFKSGKVKEPRVVMILNIESAGLSTYSSELKQFLKGIRVIGGYLFPEICDYIFAANVPWIADRFWNLIKLVLHPATASKVEICDRNRTKKLLPELIHEDHLPICFGGRVEPERKFRKASSSHSPSTASSLSAN